MTLGQRGPADRLEQLGLQLPEVPAPAAGYHPAARIGQSVLTAGQLPIVDGSLVRRGHLGDGITTDEGVALARIAALNVLAATVWIAGSLEVLRAVKLTVFVASTDSFIEQHLVANGASNLIVEVLGPHGHHARSAVGVSALPLGSPVEVEGLFDLDEGMGLNETSSGSASRMIS